MVATSQQDRPRLSIADFRGFVATRPDEEHWELIDGTAIMMAPATKAHQRIASNLERLLNDALEKLNAKLSAYQRVGLNLAPVARDYDPEPDVVVLDAEGDTDDARYSDRFYLAAEVVSASDRKNVLLKRKIYKLHPTCTCVLTIRQDRCEVRLDRRTAGHWSETILQAPNDALVLPEFGLRCLLADLYSGTPLNPRRAR